MIPTATAFAHGPVRWPFEAQRAHLSELADQSRLRVLRPAHGADFSSNDYLGLAGSARLAEAVRQAIARGVPIGSGGSRLLRGNADEHERLEQEAASFFGSESCLFFSSGYAANTALLATLPQRGDLVIYDELVHASVHEGMRLGRAETRSASHNGVEAFEAILTDWRRSGGTGQVWLAVESLYSMDGDRAPLTDLAEIADKHQAILLIDEAHATGLCGENGRGLAEALDGRENVITLRTCGKALGCEGALVCAPRIVRDFLVNRGRGFIFSTAPSPLIAAAIRASLRILADAPELRSSLWTLVGHAERALAPHGVAATGSQILPLILGDAARTMRVAQAVQDAGFDVRGIRPPTVPQGSSRLRISITLNACPEDIDGLSAALGEALR
jgi:8-amino-7-oxononanoate synthase